MRSDSISLSDRDVHTFLGCCVRIYVACVDSLLQLRPVSLTIHGSVHSCTCGGFVLCFVLISGICFRSLWPKCCSTLSFGKQCLTCRSGAAVEVANLHLPARVCVALRKGCASRSQHHAISSLLSQWTSGLAADKTVISNFWSLFNSVLCTIRERSNDLRKEKMVVVQKWKHFGKGSGRCKAVWNV